MGRLTGSSSSGGGRLNLGSSQTQDLSTLEGLTSLVQQAGLSDQVESLKRKPKLSFLQRISKALGAFNPAEAVLTGTEKGFGAGLKKYATGIGTGIASGITGTDYEGDRRSFRDVVQKFGVENGILKFGLGVAGDILLDPSTYFGGALAKGLIAGTKVGTKAGVKILGKVSPDIEQGLTQAAEGLKDAFGRAFRYGYRSSEGAAQDVLTFMSRSDRARLGLAGSNLNRLGTGTLTKSQQEELAINLIAGKRAEFGARQAGKTTQEAGQIGRQTALGGIKAPETKEIAEQQLARSKQFGESLGLENPYEVYFPFIKSDKLEKFLKESQGIKVGSEGYRKQFKNLLTNENIELDPAKAFFTREAQIVTDRMTRDFLHGFVGKYGKKLDDFKSSDEALAAGYHLIKDKGLFGKAVGYVNKYDAALLRDSLSPEFQTLNMLAKATGFDALTSLFKRSVTGLFLPFHVRNYTSGIIQNFEALGPAALNPKNIAVGQKIAYLMARGKKIPGGTVEIAGQSVKMSTIMKPFLDRFSGDTFYTADFLDALKNGGALKAATKTFSRTAAKETLKTAGLGSNAVPFKAARAIGQFVEHQQKATAYVTALGQGKTIQESLKLAEKAGFDYRALTRFESQVLRRIIPFYSFTRKNIELQLKTLGENPQRINQVLSFFEGAGETMTEEEKQNLPNYIREALAVKLKDTPDGLKQYITSFGTPIEQFAQLFGSNPVLRTISQTNPILKVPIELGIGKDSFRQQDLKDTYTANEYKAAPQIIKDMLDFKEVEKPTYKRLGDGKLIKIGTRTTYVADPVKLLVARSLFTSRGVTYLDQLFGGDLKGFIKVLKTTTGLKPTAPIDIEQLKKINQTKVQREIEDLLTKYGVTKQFTRTYIPKQ